MHKVVHLSSAHSATDTRIFVRQCRSLASAGYDAVVIAAHDETAVVDGVRIVPVQPGQRRMTRMTVGCWQVLRAALRERAALYHFHDPELIPVGLLLRLLGKRVVYDVHEDVPKQILSKDYIPRVLRRSVAAAVRLVEAFGARVFNGIIAATPCIALRFRPATTVTVQNFPVLGELDVPSGATYEDRENIVAYVGGIALVRGAREIVQAMSLLSQESNARLAMAGAFSPPELRRELAALRGWERVDAKGWIDRDGVAQLLGSARIGLVTLLPLPNYLDAYPVKMFEYMYTGLPIVASDFPLWRSIVTNARCGLVVNPCDPQAIADALEWLLMHPAEAEAMGLRGRAAVQGQYNWSSEEAKLLGLYKRLLAR